MLDKASLFIFGFKQTKKGRHYGACPSLISPLRELALARSGQYLQVGSREIRVEGKDFVAAQVLYDRVVHAVGEGKLGLLVARENCPGTIEDNAVGHKEAYQVGVVDDLADGRPAWSEPKTLSAV